jgi:uncharacterized protein YecE (DUF72 family)
MAGSVFIGTSGWNYRHWRNDRFYPRGLGQKEWLHFYARHFCTVELNSTFYRLPPPETFAHWARTVPAEFVFAVKASRFITHIKRLKEPEESVRRFLSHASRLGKKLGPALFQLPPQMTVDPGRIKGLIQYLKRRKGLKVVFEFRHESWFTNEVYELLEDAGWTICLADWPGLKQSPLLGPFCYIRRHGASALYASCYSDEQLLRDAEFAMRLAKKGKDVYIYFNNDAQAHAVKNAQTLIGMIKPTYLASRTCL